MKLELDELARKLQDVVGGQAVSVEPARLGSFSIDGQPAALLCLPSSAVELSAALRVCAEADAAVTPWGGGTAIHMGNRPRRVEVAISLSRLDHLVEHDDANLTATLQAGMSLARLQEMAAPREQFFPVDVPFPQRASVGGMIAANLNGPRRICYGSIRDLVIGIKAVLATGEQIKAGGKVVKNVAGYDLGKLFVGSLGTLGIITEATLRMAPLPEIAGTLISSGTLAQVFELADQIARSTLLPAAMVVSNSRASRGGEPGGQKFHLALWAEGFEAAVARHLRDAQAMSERIGLQSESLDHPAHLRFWDEVRDFPLATNRSVIRVTVPRGSLPAAVKKIEGWKTADFDFAVIADALSGCVWIAAAAEDGPAEQFARMGALAREHGGHAIMLAAPPEVKKNLDVWGAPPPGFPLMREIKRQFDPHGLLNPGRFVGGI
jgi:glycolate oxidase FAD binding subunit